MTSPLPPHLREPARTRGLRPIDMAAQGGGVHFGTSACHDRDSRFGDPGASCARRPKASETPYWVGTQFESVSHGYPTTPAMATDVVDHIGTLDEDRQADRSVLQFTAQSCRDLDYVLQCTVQWLV